jgi:hypothetical protein
VLSESIYSDVSSAYLYHYETSAIVCASPDEVFDHLDDHTRPAAHMSESSWMMGGGSMQVELDAARGQRVGSCIRLNGKILGIALFVEEIVTERTRAAPQSLGNNWNAQTSGDWPLSNGF